MAELKTIRLDQLPVASSVIVDNGQVLIVYGGGAYRATATLMKGPKGDKMLFTDLTSADIATLQQPARDMISQLQQTNALVTQAESLRVQEESARVLAEKGRVQAEQGRDNAEQNRVSSEQERKAGETTRVSNESTRESNEQARIANEQERILDEEIRQEQEQERQTNTSNAVTKANDAADRLDELSDNLPEIRDGFWWIYNEVSKEYENSGEKARGDVMYATFEVDFSTGELLMNTPNGYNGPVFELEGQELYVII